jgi:hypothetical protein
VDVDQHRAAAYARLADRLKAELDGATSTAHSGLTDNGDARRAVDAA